MSGFLLIAVGVLGGLGLAVIGDMLSEEVRDRLDYLPHGFPYRQNAGSALPANHSFYRSRAG